jgi:hypothetical protein
MRLTMQRAVIAFVFFFTAAACCQSVNPALLERPWPAYWIAHPTASPTDFGVYHFRKAFTLAARPEHFIVHISADNRYRLFANGRSVSTGPAQSDLLNWRFETVDLAPYLQAGNNVLAAVVWNGGIARPMAQISHRTGFLLQTDDPANHTRITTRISDGTTTSQGRASGWMRPGIRGDGSSPASTTRAGFRRPKSTMQLRRASKATSAGNSSRAPCHF